MNNKDLKNSDERKQLLQVLEGTINLNGTLEFDDDDNDGHVTIVQKWTFNGEQKQRALYCQLLVKDII